VGGRQDVDKAWIQEVRNTRSCPNRKVRIVPRFHLEGWDFDSLYILFSEDRTRILALVSAVVDECVYVAAFSLSLSLSLSHILSALSSFPFSFTLFYFSYFLLHLYLE
jgi:hypothetical protein